MNLNEMIEEYLKIRNIKDYRILEVFKNDETLDIRLVKEKLMRNGTIRTDAFNLCIDKKEMEIQTMAVHLNRELKVNETVVKTKKLKL